MLRTLLICGLVAGHASPGSWRSASRTSPASPRSTRRSPTRRPTRRPRTGEGAELVSRDDAEGRSGCSPRRSSTGSPSAGSSRSSSPTSTAASAARARPAPRCGSRPPGSSSSISCRSSSTRRTRRPSATPTRIGDRTALYIVMVWISIFSAIAAVRLRRALSERRPVAVATFLAGRGLPRRSSWWPGSRCRASTRSRHASRRRRCGGSVRRPSGCSSSCGRRSGSCSRPWPSAR